MSHQVRVGGFQGLAVQAAAGDGVPGGFPAVALEDFGSLVHHLQLYGILDSLDLCGGFLHHGLQFPQFLYLQVDFLNAHWVYLLCFDCRLSGCRRSFVFVVYGLQQAVLKLAPKPYTHIIQYIAQYFKMGYCTIYCVILCLFLVLRNIAICGIIQIRWKRWA